MVAKKVAGKARQLVDSSVPSQVELTALEMAVWMVALWVEYMVEKKVVETAGQLAGLWVPSRVEQ